MLSLSEVQGLCRSCLDRTCDLFNLPSIPLKEDVRVDLIRTIMRPDASGVDQPQIDVNARGMARELNRDCDDRQCNFAIVLWHIGHETFHVAAGHLVDPKLDTSLKARHRAELAADFAGGWVLGKLGVTTQEATRMLQRLSPTRTETHPSSEHRKQAVLMGQEAGQASKDVHEGVSSDEFGHLAATAGQGLLNGPFKASAGGNRSKATTMEITKQILDQFNIKFNPPDWSDVSPQANGMSYADVFAEGVCRAIPGCMNEHAATRAARMQRIKEGIRTLWHDPVHMLQDYNAVLKMAGSTESIPTSGPNLLPPWESPFWQMIRLLMRFHAATEAPADLLAAGSHTVADGETPMIISLAYTGDSGRYEELVEANPHIPAVLASGGTLDAPRRTFHGPSFRPGMQINLPLAWRSTKGLRAPRHVRYPRYPLWYEYQGYGWPPGQQSSLKRKLTREQFWREATTRIHPAIPLDPGWIQRAKDFLKVMLPGDEIWSYDTIRRFTRTRGYYLMQGGSIVADLVAVGF